MTRIHFKILWVLPWPMLHPVTKLHRKSLAGFHLLTNKQTIHSTNIASLAVVISTLVHLGFALQPERTVRTAVIEN